MTSIADLLAERERKRRSEAVKRWWTPERRAEASVKARAASQAWRRREAMRKKLSPLRQQAYQECFSHRWPYSNVEDKYRVPLSSEALEYYQRLTTADAELERHYAICRSRKK